MCWETFAEIPRANVYQIRLQTFPIPLFDRGFYAAKTYLFLANLYELLLMNRNAFIKNCSHSPLKILKQVFSGGGRLPSVRKPHIMTLRSIFASKTKRKCILGMSAYEMGTKSQYQRFQAWFQITLPQTSPLDQLPRPGVQACVRSGTPATSPMPGTAQTTRCPAKKMPSGGRSVPGSTQNQPLRSPVSFILISLSNASEG